jgi:hypothetical protein
LRHVATRVVNALDFALSDIDVSKLPTGIEAS